MKKSRSLLQKLEPYLYLVPAFVFLIVFVFYPFCKNAWMSLHTVNQFRLVKSFVGFRNYAKVLGDEAFIRSIANTFTYVLVTVPASMVIAYLLAMLARKKRRFSVGYEVLFAISMAASDAVIAMIFQLAYNNQLGIINKVFGLNIDWLHDSRYALMSLMIIQIWKNIGYNFLFMLSALRGLSEDVLEAARLDGVTGLKLHLKIIIPLVSPMLFFLLIKDIAYGMTVSSYTLILTGGGPDNATHTIITYIYSKAIESTNYNYAFAATMIGFFISAVLIAFSMVLEKRKVHYN